VVLWDAAARQALLRLATPGIIAPGQACVMYDEERVLGGGFLRRPGSVDTTRAAA